MLRGVKNWCGARLVDGCRRNNCEWLNKEVEISGAQKRRAFEKWMQERSGVAHDNYTESRNVVKRVVRTAMCNADAR